VTTSGHPGGTRRLVSLPRPQHGTPLLINHSHRVYLFAAAMGKLADIHFDAEMLFVAAAFHDLGLVDEYKTEPVRFEVIGANLARGFLARRMVADEKIEIVWDAIALHTTPGITQYKQPEVALLYAGVDMDVIGAGYTEFPVELREDIVSRYPRINFKQDIVRAFLGGFAHKTVTTEGTINEDICIKLMPGYRRRNFCDEIEDSPFPDSTS